MDCRKFGPDLTSVPAARAFVRSCLDDVNQVETIVLLVSELATNAVIHARTPFEVSVGRTEDCVRVSVADANSAAPVLRDATSDDTSGRGLQIVSALADEWGTDLQHDGTRIWFKVDV